MGKDLKKTLPNPECELFYPEDKTAHMKTETFGFPE